MPHEDLGQVIKALALVGGQVETLLAPGQARRDVPGLNSSLLATEEHVFRLLFARCSAS